MCFIFNIKYQNNFYLNSKAIIPLFLNFKFRPERFEQNFWKLPYCYIRSLLEPLVSLKANF